MGLMTMFYKKTKQADLEPKEQKSYTDDLGDTKTLGSLIKFLTPKQCAKVLQIQADKSLRNKYLEALDTNSVPKADYLKAAKTCAAYKESLGYDMDAGWKEIDATLSAMAKGMGEGYESLQQVKNVEFVDKMQKTIVPLLILDAIRQNPKRHAEIMEVLAKKGKDFIVKQNIPTQKSGESR